MKKNLWEFYSSFISNWISRGEMINRNNLSSLGITPLFDRIITKTSIKKVICIYKFPINYSYCLSAVLNNLVFTTDPSCTVYTNTYSLPTKVDTRSDVFKRQMASTESRYSIYKEFFDSMSNTEKLVGKKVRLGGMNKITINTKDRDNLESEYLSYEYIHKVTSNGGKLSDTFMFIEIIAPNNKAMKKVHTQVIDYLFDSEFIFKDLSANSSNYLSNFTPTTYIHEKNSKEFSNILFSDENITHTIPYKTQGFIGDGSGELLGFDMRSKTPLIINFFESGARQICLVSAPSGWGKTWEMFQIALSFLKKHHVSVIDIKGDEWTKLESIVGKEHTAIIDISESSSSFVNLLRLDDVDVRNTEGAREFYNMSVSALIELINIICDPTEENKRTCESLSRQAIDKVFSTSGVDPSSPKTFKYTRTLTYLHIIDALESLKTSPSYTQWVNLIDLMKVRLDDKFRHSNVFKGREVSVRDIINSPLVIYSLNRNKDSMQSSNDAIRTFMISFLDMKKISIRKSEGKGTICFYEEMQRKREFISLMNFISSIVTGARSSNVVVFLICNSIRTFMEEDMASITSNISSYIIGPVEDKEDYKCFERLNCSSILPLLKDLSENKEKYANQFVVKFDTGKTNCTTVMKSIVPKKYLDSNSFSTRDLI